jgi:hypothetical protein
MKVNQWFGSTGCAAIHSDYRSDPVTDITVPMGGPVGGETSIPRSITRWSWTFLRIEGEWLISKMAYPESVLLRKDVLDDNRARAKL